MASIEDDDDRDLAGGFTLFKHYKLPVKLNYRGFSRLARWKLGQ